MGVLQLQEKNYTNPEDRGRFGFSMSGDFYTPYKFETVLVIALIAVAVTEELREWCGVFCGGLSAVFASGGVWDWRCFS